MATRASSPPVRDTEPQQSVPRVSSARRKPLHEPTDRQIKASEASRLRQQLAASKAALAALNEEEASQEIVTKRRPPRTFPTNARRRQNQKVRPAGGLLRPKVVGLGRPTSTPKCEHKGRALTEESWENAATENLSARSVS